VIHTTVPANRANRLHLASYVVELDRSFRRAAKRFSWRRKRSPTSSADKITGYFAGGNPRNGSWSAVPDFTDGSPKGILSPFVDPIGDPSPRSRFK
jgi:hypothetical protein